MAQEPLAAASFAPQGLPEDPAGVMPTTLPPQPATGTATAPNTIADASAPAPQQLPASAFAPGPQQALFPPALAPFPAEDFEDAAPTINVTAEPALSYTSGLPLDANGQAVYVVLPPLPATGSESTTLPPPEVILAEQLAAAESEEASVVCACM